MPKVRFRDAIGQDPENGDLFQLLASSQFHQVDGEQRAIQSIDQSIRLVPENAEAFALKAHILVALKKPADALKAADQAVGLDPYLSMAFTAKTLCLLSLSRWRDAEESARHALSLDPDDVIAANFLAQALRLQNKMRENAGADSLRVRRKDPRIRLLIQMLAGPLSRMVIASKPKALFRGAAPRPERSQCPRRHAGSFQGSISFYRAYLSYCLYVQRLSERFQFAVIIGLFRIY